MSQLGVANVPPAIFDSGIYGLFGLGSRNGETISFHDPNATFPTIYDQLVLRGYTTRRLFSLWLNKQSAVFGSLLFGGIDTTKYHGELRSVPVLLPGPKQGRVFTGWQINLTSISYINGSSGDRVPLTGNFSATTIVMDSASPNMYLPFAIADNVAARMGASMQQGFPYVSCSLREQRDQLLEFSFGKSSSPGPRIRVPFPEIIYPYGAPANIGNVTAENGTPLCYLGLIGTGGPIYILGATFIRSAYVVFDVDNLQISMAPAAYGNGS